MRNSISKGISSRFAELSRSGGGVRAVKLALCAAVLAEAAGAQPYADWRIDTFAGRPAFVDGGPAVGCMIQLRREWGRFSNFSFRTPQRRISAYPARPSG